MPAALSISSVSSAKHDNEQGNGAKGSSFPQFNLPESYWTRDQASLFHTELSLPQDRIAVVKDALANLNHSTCVQNMLDRLEEDKENDPRCRVDSSAILREMMLQMHAVNHLDTSRFILLEGPADGEAPSQSSTSSTSSSAATAAQQEAAVSGCCVPPSCSIL